MYFHMKTASVYDAKAYTRTALFTISKTFFPPFSLFNINEIRILGAFACFDVYESHREISPTYSIGIRADVKNTRSILVVILTLYSTMYS